MDDLKLVWADRKGRPHRVSWFGGSTTFRFTPRSSRTRKGLPSRGGVEKTWLLLDRLLSVTSPLSSTEPASGLPFPSCPSVQFKYPSSPNVLVPTPSGSGFRLVGQSSCPSAVTQGSPAQAPPSSESPENNFKMAAAAARKTMGQGCRGQAEA